MARRVARQSNPFYQKLRREVALLLFLGEISSTEIIQLYQLEEEKKHYKKLLAVWKSRAGTRYKKLDPIEQQIERKAAIQRFYGIHGAAIKLSTFEASIEATTEIQADPDFQGLGEDLSSQEPPEELVREVAPTPPVTQAAMVTPLQESIVSEATYNTLMMDLKAGSLENFSNLVKSLQNDSLSGIHHESNLISNIISKLQTYDINGLDLKDLKTFIQILEQAITLRRKALILPFGHVNPDSKITNNNSSHLHLHNHGLGSFNPVKQD